MEIMKGTQVIDCPECEAHVAAELLETLDVEDPPWALRARYCFLKCPKCGSALLTAQSDDGPGWDPPVRVFPSRDTGLGWAIPEQIRKAYDEARASFSAGAFTASAIMCRKAVEGLCVDKKASGRTLATRLKALRESGVVDSRLFDWADELRVWGNDAAHDVAITIGKADATDLLEFTRAYGVCVYLWRTVRRVSFKTSRPKAAVGYEDP